VIAFPYITGVEEGSEWIGEDEAAEVMDAGIIATHRMMISTALTYRVHAGCLRV
jgi:hypothetical protein